jgi:hypothetical protein
METIALPSTNQLQSQRLTSKLSLTKVTLIRKQAMHPKPLSPLSQLLTISHASFLSYCGKKETSVTLSHLQPPPLKVN